MKQTFSDDQLKPFQEYFVMLENVINKDKPKAKEPEKKEEVKVRNVKRHIRKALAKVQQKKKYVEVGKK